MKYTVNMLLFTYLLIPIDLQIAGTAVPIYSALFRIEFCLTHFWYKFIVCFKVIFHICLKNFVSSADINTSDKTSLGRSLMKITNRIGSSTDPCGIPLVTLFQCDFWPVHLNTLLSIVEKFLNPRASSVTYSIVPNFMQ